MEGKTFTVTFSENEINIVWQMLMNGSVTGQNAIHVVTASQKIQSAVNAVNNPAPTTEADKTE